MKNQIPIYTSGFMFFSSSQNQKMALLQKKYNDKSNAHIKPLGEYAIKSAKRACND
ncbi:MAG: hypothetical protein ACREHC_07575 [Candidatus Levyibacteriota bacterium]